MLNHISIGVSSLPAAKAFYDATLSALGYRCLSEDAGSLGYGSKTVEFWVLKSGKPAPDETGSGLHICFTAPSTESVNRFHGAGSGMAVVTTANPVCVPIMGLTTLQPSSRTPTATESKPTAARNLKPAARWAADNNNVGEFDS